MFVADSGNNRVREIDSLGTITTVAGDGIAAYTGDGGMATAADLNDPGGVAVDAEGNLVIADIKNNRVRDVGGPIADLKVTESQSEVDLPAGDTEVYKVRVTNIGPSTASAVVATDNAPVVPTAVSASQGSCGSTSVSVTCDVGAVASEQTVTVKVSARLVEPGSAINTASALFATF